MSQHILKHILVACLFCPIVVIAQQNTYEDNITDIIQSKKENQSVMLTAVVSKWLDEKSLVVDDKTGVIGVFLKAGKKPDLIAGDEITLTGKVKLNDAGKKFIEMTSYRKLRFIKNPANCCRPEKER